jgi:hypothetical protein
MYIQLYSTTRLCFIYCMIKFLKINELQYIGSFCLCFYVDIEMCQPRLEKVFPQERKNIIVNF